jgi:hypothetical protein
MTLALFGAGIVIYEFVNRQLASDDQAPVQNATRTRSSVGLTASNQTVLGAALLAAVLVTAVVITVFISWDMRRLSAGRILAIDHDNTDLNIRAGAWSDAQAIAPERQSFTENLFDQYLITAEEQHALGNVNEAMRLLMIGREMLRE